MLLTHDHPTTGHPGQDETIRKAKKFWSWKGMNEWIANYIKGCAICQQNKILTHQKKMPLYWITIEQGTLPFKQVVMDLIMGVTVPLGPSLSTSVLGFCCEATCLLTFVCDCSQYDCGTMVHRFDNDSFVWVDSSSDVIAR
jgi:hypothetical protein